MNLELLLRQLFQWRAIFDILLMSIGLFFLYRTLQRLGTWRIALGILSAMGVYLLSILLSLKGIMWLFGNLSHVALIALIVIFQPEIRKVFERAASMRRTRPADPGNALTSTLVSALWDLSQKRHGAIIVLPGNEPVQQWLSGGYQLNGSPSLPLIMSIFDPEQFSAKIDLSKAVAGKQTFVITAENMKLSRSIRLLDVVPAAVELTLAETVEQEIEIKPQFIGELPEDRKILVLKVIPAKVKVISPVPDKDYKTIHLLTTPIYLESLNGNTHIFCKLIAPPAIVPANKPWPDVEVIIRVAKVGY